jgi:hypothetical protein
VAKAPRRQIRRAQYAPISVSRGPITHACISLPLSIGTRVFGSFLDALIMTCGFPCIGSGRTAPH